MLALINPGLGNIGSVRAALSLLDINYIELTSYSDAIHLDQFNKFILPGVGSFDYGYSQLVTTGLDRVVHYLVNRQCVGLGICLGMQLMLSNSNEGGLITNGLQHIPGLVRKLNPKSARVPHIGWSSVTFNTNYKYLFSEFSDSYYFVHSYAAVEVPAQYQLCSSVHGTTEFISGIAKNNLYGVQFHPEKSHESGLQFLKKLFTHQ